MSNIINLIGAPGSGKSVTRADAFCRLKRAGVTVEEVTEFAKDLVYEERQLTMRCQPYIAAKQLRNLERLDGKVDVILTDSALVLCSYYNRKYRAGAYPDSFDRWVIDQYKAMGGTTVFLQRVKPYECSGRMQTADESDVIASELLELLGGEGIPYVTLPGDETAAAWIENHVLDLIGRANSDLSSVTPE